MIGDPQQDDAGVTDRWMADVSEPSIEDGHETVTSGCDGGNGGVVRAGEALVDDGVDVVAESFEDWNDSRRDHPDDKASDQVVEQVRAVVAASSFAMDQAAP